MASTPNKTVGSAAGIAIGIRDLKANLSAHLRRVKAGSVLIVAERGRPICRIIPETISQDRRIEQLVQTGLIAWRGCKLGNRTPTAKLKGKKTVADLLLEDRE